MVIQLSGTSHGKVTTSVSLPLWKTEHLDPYQSLWQALQAILIRACRVAYPEPFSPHLEASIAPYGVSLEC
jgi:hypothetical protein